MPAYQIGDVVIHTASETRMAVERVRSDEVYCVWKAGDKFDSRWFPSATVHPASGTGKKTAAPVAKVRPAPKKEVKRSKPKATKAATTEPVQAAEKAE